MAFFSKARERMNESADKRARRNMERERLRERNEKLDGIALRESIKQNKGRIARERMKQDEIKYRRLVKEEKRKTFNKKYVEPLQKLKSKPTKKSKVVYQKKKSVFDTGRNPFQ